jgi:lysozyme
MGMHLSDDGIQAIYRRECSAPTFQPALTAYQDSGGNWTIGCGHTGGVHEGQTITRAQADELFRRDIAPCEDAVNSAVKVTLLQPEFDALCSFAFNVGVGAFHSSTLLKKLNEGSYSAVPGELRRWNKSNGQVNRGLVNRRESEIAQWNGIPFVSSATQNVDVPKSRLHEIISQFHLQLKALGVGSLLSGIGADKLQDAGNQFQGLAQHSHWFAIIGVSLIVLGIVYKAARN